MLQDKKVFILINKKAISIWIFLKKLLVNVIRMIVNLVISRYLLIKKEKGGNMKTHHRVKIMEMLAKVIQKRLTSNK